MKMRALIVFDQRVSLYAIAGAATATLDDHYEETATATDGDRTLVATVPASVEEQPRGGTLRAGRPEQVVDYRVTIRHPRGAFTPSHAWQVDWLLAPVGGTLTLYVLAVTGTMRGGLLHLDCARRQ